jgi:hypothetical protein
MSNPFHYNELLYPLSKGDTPGHAFHGNQFTAGNGGGKNTADKIMDAVNKYGDEHPDAQMNKGWQTAMEQAKMIGEHKMAIPKSLVDSATKEDMDKLTDNNYHSARTAIEHQRPELADKPRTKEVDLGNYFKSESLLYPLTKGDSQAKRHRKKAEYHRTKGVMLLHNGFYIPAGLHHEAAEAHENAAEAHENDSSASSSEASEATSTANTASVSAESASASAGVSSGGGDAGGGAGGGDGGGGGGAGA